MTGNPVEPLERADFLRLASVCGLRLSPTDLFQLERHKLLCALDVEDSSAGTDLDGTYYCALHLYVLATYLDGVRTYRHPWSSISGEREHDEIELDELGARCRELDGIIVGLSRWNQSGSEAVIQTGDGLDSQSVIQLARDIERYSHGIDPFGPLSGIVDMMRADVVEKLRGAGRLYGELRRMSASLAVMAEQLSEAALVAVSAAVSGVSAVSGTVSETGVVSGAESGVLKKTTTREMVGIGFVGDGADVGFGARPTGLIRARTEIAGEPPTIAISIDEVPVDDLRRTQLIERSEVAESRVDYVDLSGGDFEKKDPISAALSMTRSERKEDAPNHGFGREESATSRTMDLNARLERLRRQDLQQLAERDVASVFSESTGLGDARSEALDDALSEALDGAFEDVLDDGALDEMLDGALEQADGADSVLLEKELVIDEDLVENEVSDAVLLENELDADEDLVENEVSDAVLLEDDLFAGEQIEEHEASEAVVLETELFEDENLLGQEESDAVLLELDDESLDSGLDIESEVLESGPSSIAEGLSEKIAELNRLREQYLAAQSWSQLVELYEDGIGLFVDSNERQQVYLVLGTLYEIKLKEKGRAMDSFIRAFGEVGNQAGTDKALAGMKRLGPLPEVQDRYLANLEDQLAGELEDDDRRYLQRFHALALYGAGEYQRAFLLYASMLAENPDENVNPQSLGDLELLGAEVDIEEVLDFYHDILEQNVLPEIRQWVQNRVEAL